jgi:Kef-type K+ transport system membrane component KefB
VDILLLMALTYAIIATVGSVVTRLLRLPWMFTVIVSGLIFTTLGLFSDAFASPSFGFLTQMGMLFFLFTIGMDLDLGRVRELGAHIVGGNILLTLSEGLCLGLFFYLVFPAFVYGSLPVAILAGLAFGTVGEVVLVAILKEFGLEKTRFGQLALGIGVFDDVFELLALAGIVALPAFVNGGAAGTAWQGSLTILLTLAGIIVVTAVVGRMSRFTRLWLERISNDEAVIPFLIFAVVFAFIYFSSRAYESVGVVGAIFSGIAVERMLPPKFLAKYKKPVFFVGKVFLGPFFFLSLGSKMSFAALATYPFLVLAIMGISLTVRVAVSYLLFHRLLGKRPSLAMGVGLTSKFSTSIISENLLFSAGLIAQPLYSAMMAAFILLKPVIVGIFSHELAVLQDVIAEESAVRTEELVPVPVAGISTD